MTIIEKAAKVQLAADRAWQKLNDFIVFRAEAERLGFVFDAVKGQEIEDALFDRMVTAFKKVDVMEYRYGIVVVS